MSNLKLAFTLPSAMFKKKVFIQKIVSDWFPKPIPSTVTHWIEGQPVSVLKGRGEFV